MGNFPKVEAVFGPMYAGKSSELMKRILWLAHQNLEILVIKPKLDNRYSANEIVTHTGHKYPCEYVTTLLSYIENNKTELKKCHSVFIDEIQFFELEDVKKSMAILRDLKINVVAAGLDQDSSGDPFDSSAYILAISDSVSKIQSYCNVCGQPATKTYKLQNSGNRVDVASYGIYEPRCLEHWEPKK